MKVLPSVLKMGGHIKNDFLNDPHTCSNNTKLNHAISLEHDHYPNIEIFTFLILLPQYM